MKPDSLPKLLMLWEDSLGRGQELTPEDLCAGQPSLVEAVREGIALARRCRAGEPVGQRAARGSNPPGYEILGELGRGGMGVVYKARQAGLNRVVALKMILSGGHAGEDERARFLTEAEAVAKVRHPSIVQVYDFGTHDGLPWFSLEFCEGGSLADSLNGTPLPPRHAAELAEKIARAIQAAHRAGVVHRDLKPGNVLLTTAGRAALLAPDAKGNPGCSPFEYEPKVTDFGLAKRVEGGGNTNTGAIMGTPSYMPPEQARGQRDVGPLADVYSIGAVLYECLSGRPPFRSAVAYDTLRQVVNNQPVPLRQLNAKVPSDLETICHKCLAKEPARRYASAEALADDLRRFLDGKPIEARPAGRFERLVRWARREPVVASLLAGVLLSLTAGVSVSAALAVTASRSAGAAREAADRAEDNLKLAKQAIDDCFSVCKDDPLFQEPRMEKARKKLLANTLPFYKRFREARPGEYGLQVEEARQWSDVAYISNELGDKSEALTGYQRSVRIYAELVSAHPDAAEYQQGLTRARNNLGALLSLLGKRDEALREYNQALRTRARLAEANPNVPAYQSDLSNTHNSLGNLLESLGKRDEAAREYQQAVEIRVRLAAAHPENDEYQADLASSLFNLGQFRADQGKRGDALRDIEQARQTFARLAAKHPRDAEYQRSLARCHNQIAVQNVALGNRDEGLRWYQESARIRARLAATHPDVPAIQQELARARDNLGSIFIDLDRRPEALKEYQEARAIRARLVDTYPEIPEYQKDLASTHYSLGSMLNDVRKPEEALREFLEVRRIQEKLVNTYPKDPEYQRALAYTHQALGVLFGDLGKPEEAKRECRSACRLLAGLTATQPDVPEHQRALAFAHNSFGNLLADHGEGGAAMEELRKATTLLAKLASEHPEVPDNLASLAMVRGNVARLLDDLGRWDEAEKEYGEALEIREKLVAAHPGVAKYRFSLAQTRNNLGTVLQQMRKRDAAEKEFRQALSIVDQLVTAHPDILSYQQEQAGVLHNLAQLLADRGERAEAAKLYLRVRQAREKRSAANPNVLAYQHDLAETLVAVSTFERQSGQAEAALKTAEQALPILLTVNKQHPGQISFLATTREAHRARAEALSQLGRHREAIADWEAALRLEPDPAARHSWRVRVAMALARAGDFRRSRAEVEDIDAAVAFSPESLLEFAKVFCLNAVTVGHDKGLPLAVREHLAEKYPSAAVALLRRAGQDATNLAKDADFDILRGRTDFHALPGTTGQVPPR